MVRKVEKEDDGVESPPVGIVHKPSALTLRRADRIRHARQLELTVEIKPLAVASRIISVCHLVEGDGSTTYSIDNSKAISAEP